MPIFSLGRLGRFQIALLPPLDASSPSKHQTPPPEYVSVSESETKYHAPSQAQPPKCKTEQVCRFLIEILALTFNANFDELNAALYNIPVASDTNTILCDSERADLLVLSDVVCKVHGHFLRNEIMTTDRKDEENLCAAIILPVANIVYDCTLPSYALDMIGWYGEEVRSPSGTRWADTIPGYWETDPFKCTKGHQAQVKECMSAFLNIIKYVSPNHKVHSVLREAWDDARRRCGLGQLGHSLVCWPMRVRYYEMGASLQGLVQLGPWHVVDGS